MTWSNSVVVYVECEEEREAAFHIPLTIVANSMTFVLLYT